MLFDSNQLWACDPQSVQIPFGLELNHFLSKPAKALRFNWITIQFIFLIYAYIIPAINRKANLRRRAWPEFHSLLNYKMLYAAIYISSADYFALLKDHVRKPFRNGWCICLQHSYYPTFRFTLEAQKLRQWADLRSAISPSPLAWVRLSCFCFLIVPGGPKHKGMYGIA